MISTADSTEVKYQVADKLPQRKVYDTLQSLARRLLRPDKSPPFARLKDRRKNYGIPPCRAQLSALSGGCRILNNDATGRPIHGQSIPSSNGQSHATNRN